MRSNVCIHPATCFFLLSLGTIICSWVGSSFGWVGVQNLLSEDGLRWILRNAENNFMGSKILAVVCILFFGGGLLVHSGLLDAIQRSLTRTRKLSRKQKRALVMTGVVFALYVSIFAFFAWGPWGGVRSVTCALKGSPLLDGMCCITSFGMGLTGIVYGFSVDNYRKNKDIFRGMAYLYASFAEYFVSLFFIIQFFSALEYSHLLTFWGVSDRVTCCLSVLSCIISFFFSKRYVFYVN